MTEINPYASPTVAAGYDASAGPGIGVWRDGDMFVIHRRAALPAVCIETGQPAEAWRTFNVAGNNPFAWSA
ncbi:MAG TPA: hypothetical protein VFV87_03615, partial [Pirellulaceae bacterium]|nr:hypothetical protein [Pirellulaceae bacterium]